MKKRFLLFIFALVFFITGIVNTNAYDKYDGDYTIEYLLRNYNVVTFGTKPVHELSRVTRPYRGGPGSVNYIFDMGGPVLVSGNYNTTYGLENEYAQKTNGIPSYIKGNVSSNVRPGSIESAEITDIYLGSANTIKIDGEYPVVNNYEYKFNYPTYKSDDYLNFDKLYAEVVNESKSIDKGKKIENMTAELYNKYINTSGKPMTNDPEGSAIIYEPGYYYIEDIGDYGYIYIADYDPNELYVINYYGTYVKSFPRISVKGTENNRYNFPDGYSVYCGRTNSSDTCTGNIVWNMPNARYIEIETVFYDGHLIAPNADVNIPSGHFPETFIVNSLSAPIETNTAIQYRPYKLDIPFTKTVENTCLSEVADDPSDYYEGTYSLDELLQNYSVITLGQKDYGENTELKNLTDTKGTASIFHIGGQYLISGNLGLKNLQYGLITDIDNKVNYLGIRLDKFSSDTTNYSFLKGRIMANTYRTSSIDARRMYLNYANRNYRSFISSLNIHAKDSKGNNKSNEFQVDDKIYYYSATDTRDNYINFETLYNAIVEQQKRIDAGSIVNSTENDNAYIKIGGNYTINNVSDLKNIIFTDFKDNKDRLTIITINDTGDIKLPVVGYQSETTSDLVKVYTNDYIGGNTSFSDGNKIQYYENYYGNIVWNIPNATYVELTEDAPFFGHVIAPNADVETPELHFAGAMIVNSLYSEGNSEAHFYPLTIGGVGTGIEPSVKVGDCSVDKISISGTKTWDDKDNQDGKRPKSITINLLANGEKVDSVKVTSDTNWKYEFKDIPRTKDNRKITYTITEDAVEHYSTEIDGYDVTNSYTPEKTSLTVNKVWKDEDNKDKIRPESIEVELYANGKKVDSVILNEENDWIYIFNEIDMYSNGKKIEYTVKENSVEGYTTEIIGNQENGYTIINTHELKKEEKPEKDNPVTYDNVSKFAIISVITTILLTVGIIVYQKNKKVS